MSYATRLFSTAVRFGSIALLLCACTPVWSQNPKITVMTRNMDAGTDFGFVFGATDLQTLVQGTQATFAEVEASKIPERAARLADEIAAQRPDLVALQEVTLYWTRTPGGSPTVIDDQLESLRAALATRGLSYTLVVVNELMAAEAPLSADLLFGILDRDVILVRTGIDASNPQAQRFSDAATFVLHTPGGDVPAWQGWASVDVTISGKTFRFVDTHLQSAFRGVPQTLQAQIAQGGEVVQAVNSTGLPVVLCGDFNANADPGPEHYPTTDLILAAGFTDAWRVTNADKGNTWPLHQEDPFHPLAGPYERIDLIFARGVRVVSAERTGHQLSDRTASGLWPSDHAGVVAVIELQ